MAARHVSVEWHGPSPLSPSALLVAMGSTTTKGDEDDLVGGSKEEDNRCVGCSTGRLLIVQLLAVTITVCLLSG